MLILVVHEAAGVELTTGIRRKSLRKMVILRIMSTLHRRKVRERLDKEKQGHVCLGVLSHSALTDHVLLHLCPVHHQDVAVLIASLLLPT